MLGLYFAMLETAEERSRFEYFYTTYRNTLYNYAYYILKDVHLSEDVVSEAFLVLAKKIRFVEHMEEGKVRNYLIIVTKNYAKKLYNKRIRQVSLDELSETQSSEIQSMAGDAEQEVAEHMDKEHFFKVIRSLDEKYADVLYLKYYIGLSEKEIASSLDLKVSTVRVQIHRAKQLLREMLEGEEQYGKEPV